MSRLVGFLQDDLKEIDESFENIKEMIDWAATNGEIAHKDDVEDFIDQVLNEETYKSLIQGLEKDKKEIAKKNKKTFGQSDTKFVDNAIKFLKMLEKEGIPAGQISQVDFVTNRVPKFFVGNPQKSPSFSKFTPNDVKKAVAHAKRMGILKEETNL